MCRKASHTSYLPSKEWRKSSKCVTFSEEQLCQNLPPSEMGSTLKEKNLLPFGSKFFPFRVDFFSQRSYCVGKQQEVINNVSLVKNDRKSTERIQNP